MNSWNLGEIVHIPKPNTLFVTHVVHRSNKQLYKPGFYPHANAGSLQIASQLGPFTETLDLRNYRQWLRNRKKILALLSLFAASYGQQGVLPFSSCILIYMRLSNSAREVLQSIVMRVQWTFDHFLVGSMHNFRTFSAYIIVMPKKGEPKMCKLLF